MSRRTLKAASAIREVVSLCILTQIRDPRVQDVTVTMVEVSPDMRSAKVHVSVMGDEKKQQLALRALQHAAGFLQEKIQQRVDMRYTPRLQFTLDHGVKNSLEVARILDELREEREAREGMPLDASDSTPSDNLADRLSEPSDGPAVRDPQVRENIEVDEGPVHNESVCNESVHDEDVYGAGPS